MLLRNLDRIAISSATSVDFRAEAMQKLGLNDHYFDGRKERIKTWFIDKYLTIVDFLGGNEKEWHYWVLLIMHWESEGNVTLHLAQSRQKEKPKKFVQDTLEYFR